MALYVSITNQLSSDIRDGKYRPETSLPTERELCERFGASQKTIRNALFLLRQKGLIETKRGSGSYVRSDSRRNHIINLGIVINCDQNHQASNLLKMPFFAQMLKGVSRVAAREGANSSTLIYDDNDPITDALFSGYHYDGFLNFQFTVSDSLNRYFVENRSKVVSTVSSFQEDRYHNRYTHPCIVSDHIAGIDEALKFYLNRGDKEFGYFANAAHGLHNYGLFKKALDRYDIKFHVKHTAIYPDKTETDHFVRERAEYFAEILFRDGVPDVVFSDGDFNVRELILFLSGSEEGKCILDKVRFCTIGVPELQPESRFPQSVDFVVPQHERVGEVAAGRLIEYINNGRLTQKRFAVPAAFVPARRAE